MNKIMYTREELLASAKTLHGDNRLIPAELLELPNQQGWWVKGACNSSLDLPFLQVDANNEWCIPRHNRREEMLSGYWTIAVRLRPFFFVLRKFSCFAAIVACFQSKLCVTLATRLLRAYRLSTVMLSPLCQRTSTMSTSPLISSALYSMWTVPQGKNKTLDQLYTHSTLQIGRVLVLWKTSCVPHKPVPKVGQRADTSDDKPVALTLHIMKE